MSAQTKWSRSVLGDTGIDYRVGFTQAGGYNCSCPAWIYNVRRPCKHINRAIHAHARDMATEMLMSDIAVTQSGVIVDIGTGEVIDQMPDTTHGPYNADGALAQEGDLILDDPVEEGEVSEGKAGARIKPEFLVTMQGGKTHPTWAGVLDAAHEMGLEKIKTELIQIPEESNGNVAICKATAYFSGGREFDGYGDASLKNVRAPAVQVALIRMAETRAKGRAVRDGINCGDVLNEELSDHPMQATAQSAPRQQQAAPAQTSGVPQSQRVEQTARRDEVLNGHAQPMTTGPAPNQGKNAAACSTCGKAMTGAQVTLSQHQYNGQTLCPDHQKALKEQKAQAAA